MAAVKAKENELKSEKEAARKVRLDAWCRRRPCDATLILGLGKDTESQGEAREEGGAGEVRENGRDDASQEGGTVEAQGEEEQDAQVLNGLQGTTCAIWQGIRRRLMREVVAYQRCAEGFPSS